jgi:TonB family protein
LLLPVLSIVVPPTTLEILPEKPAPPVAAPVAASVREITPPSSQPLLTGPSVAVNPSTDWTRWLGLVWALGAGVVLLQLLSALWHLYRLKRTSRPADESWTLVHDDARRKLSISKRVDLRIGANPGPLTFGVFRKTILLPETANEWSVDRRRLVLAHELAHVKRNDGFGQLLCQIVCTVHWFNPFVWYAVHRLGIERERACDDHVLVALGESAPDYADHLVQIARKLNGGFGLLAASMAQPSQLKLRVLSILDSRMRRRQMTRLTMAVLLGVAAITTLGLSSIQVARLSAMPLPAVLLPLHPPIAVAPPLQAVAKPAQVAGQEPGFVVHRMPTSYPFEARQKRIQGSVIVELTFNARGEIVDSRVLSGPEELRKAAIQTALQDNYAIGTARTLQVIVDFTIPAAGTRGISGTTTDASRVPIPGVTVIATNTETGINVVSVSNETGTYRFASLPPGNYRLTARLSGFTDQVFSNVRLADSQQVELNFAIMPTVAGFSRAWSIPASSPISLPNEFPSDVVQRVVLTGLTQPVVAEVSDKLNYIRGQRMTTDLLTQVRASIKETSWGDKPAGFVVASKTDGTADLMIGFSESLPSPQRVRIGGNVLATNLVQQVRPVYPQEAKDNRIQGVVVLEVNIAKNGTVSDARVISGHALLIPPALDALRQWVYKPVLLNGEPVEAVSTVTINFSFQQ